jgi:zeta-carotene desaturase
MMHALDPAAAQLRSVAVIGGGLAGIAASAALTRAGLDVTLIERRRLLGGRATSFEDAATGQLLDNCQHVLLGCCTNLLHLYRTLGIEDRIDLFDTLTFADETGRRGVLAAGRMPSPLHLAPAMLRFPLLSLAEKTEIAQALAAMRLLDSQDTAAEEPFAAWLADHGQSPRTIDRFWDIIITSALNERAARASARYALQVFREAFLGHRRGYVMGVPSVPLARLYDRALASRILTGTRVMAIEAGDARRPPRAAGLQPARHPPSPAIAPPPGMHPRFTLALSGGGTIAAEMVILATAPDAARRLLDGLLDVPALDGFTFRPIVGVHLFFDRPVMTEPHLALMGTELQWLFRKDARGRHVHGVISAADRQAAEGNDVLLERLLAEVALLLPRARGARLLASRIVREKRATFSPVPGIDSIRPAQATARPGLFLAGDYTQTGWPATMEGAVRSGFLAAEAVLASLGRRVPLVQPDL